MMQWSSAVSDKEPAWVHSDVGDRAASVINVELGKGLAVVAICSALCGIAAGVSAWAAYTAGKAEKESRLVQYYLMDPHSRTPDELAAWAKFNREHEEK